jgi:hypothetical protein
MTFFPTFGGSLTLPYYFTFSLISTHLFKVHCRGFFFWCTVLTKTKFLCEFYKRVFWNKSTKSSDFEGEKLELNTFRRWVPAGRLIELAKNSTFPSDLGNFSSCFTVDDGQSTYLTKLEKKNPWCIHAKHRFEVWSCVGQFFDQFWIFENFQNGRTFSSRVC